MSKYPVPVQRLFAVEAPLYDTAFVKCSRASRRMTDRVLPSPSKWHIRILPQIARW